MSLAQKTRCALQQSGITALGLGAGKVYTVMGGWNIGVYLAFMLVEPSLNLTETES